MTLAPRRRAPVVKYEPQQIVVVEISDRDELPTVEAQRCLPAHSLGPHASASEGRYGLLNAVATSFRGDCELIHTAGLTW